MKKRYITIIAVFILWAGAGFAQKETNKWYFGQSAALDFNSGVPVSLLSSQCNTSEGSASISDTAGNLLFYTDGSFVWNKNNQIMSNGTGLMGNYSSSQSALIVPLPGSDSLYYVFTLSEEASVNGFRYSIVDMSLQGGLGAVTVKNVLILSPTTEKLTATCQANNTDYWIITHGWDNNNFLVYSLTSSGLDLTPIVSSAGTVTGTNTWNAIGYLKASAAGDKLAQAIWGDNYFELFDFDKNTGEVTNALLLPSYSSATSGAYGVEFSPDDSKLYGSVISPGFIYQWDLNAGSAAAIVASKTLVGTSAVNFNGALQQATDGKIYMAEYGSAWLGVINDPNTTGTGCNYVDQGFQLSFGYNTLGLPNNFPCFYDNSSQHPASAMAALDSSICEKFCTGFFDSSTNNPTSWQWYFEGGDPASSTNQNPGNVCYSDPGTYDVTLITTNASGSDTLTLPDFITVYPTPAIPSISQNGYTLTSSPATTYQWQFNGLDIPGATNQSYPVTQSGFYSVFITNENGCTSSSPNLYVLITGLEDILSDKNIAVYPNPADDHITIEFADVSFDDELEVKIYNALGQLVFSEAEKIQSAVFSKTIAIHEFTTGIYYLEIKTSQKHFIKKLVFTNNQNP